MIIRQSDLSSYSRCPQQKKLQDQQRAGLLSKAPEQLSRTAYGSVVHHAVRVLDERYHKDLDDPLGHARATFEYYWDPEHISAITQAVTIWQVRDTWSGMLRKGLASLSTYYEWIQKDTAKVLGLEVPFWLPYMLDGEEHTIHGTMDKLTLRRGSHAFINIEDTKTGKDYEFLRWNNQFTVYCWATLQPLFWEQWDNGDELYHRFRLLPRRGTWVSLHAGLKRSDAGWRGAQDYARMDVALREYVKANRADVFPLSLTGAVCQYCPFREGICGGVPVPAEDYGKA